MLETLSVRPRICDQIRSGPLGRWVDDFVDVLMTRGYATGTVRACRRMSSATLPRCTCSRPASTWRPSRCGSATSDSKPPINTSRRTCNSRKTLCENSSRSVNERSGSRPTPRCWPSWRASDYDKQTTCWTPTATVSPTVTCHNAMLVILTGMTSWSYLSVPRARQQWIEGTALTNVPALAMPALASNSLAAGPVCNAGGDPNAPLTTEERAVCGSFRISEEAFRKSRARRTGKLVGAVRFGPQPGLRPQVPRPPRRAADHLKGRN